MMTVQQFLQQAPKSNGSRHHAVCADGAKISIQNTPGMHVSIGTECVEVAGLDVKDAFESGCYLGTFRATGGRRSHAYGAVRVDELESWINTQHGGIVSWA